MSAILPENKDQPNNMAVNISLYLLMSLNLKWRKMDSWNVEKFMVTTMEPIKVKSKEL